MASKCLCNFLWDNHNVQLMSNWCCSWVEYNVLLRVIGPLKIILSSLFESFCIFSDRRKLFDAVYFYGSQASCLIGPFYASRLSIWLMWYWILWCSMLLCFFVFSTQKADTCSLDTPENLRWQQQRHVAGCSLPICAKLSICAALFGSATIVSGFGSIWPCHSRNASITTKCKVMENQSWEEAVVKRISPVAVVALFHVLWIFFWQYCNF